MDGAQKSKLRQTLFERLLVGESRAALDADLRQRLDETEARALLDEAVSRIRVCRAEGSYDNAAATVRKRRVVSRYAVWRWLAGVLLLFAGLGFLGSLINKTPAFPFGLIVAGIMLALVEWRLRGRLEAAEAAVDQLLDEAAA
ncbi:MULTISPECIES: hypothetical protein [unclassified Caulobacter]|uniref:hypothetical protein n=1 Tax=unclassified Caulobacter TaxID=2648921 RepID=UPI0011B46BCC|nr:MULTISPECIES: hypothetical protein [unclassified Caulobacter]